jgi:hypothetical protein
MKVTCRRNAVIGSTENLTVCGMEYPLAKAVSN